MSLLLFHGDTTNTTKYNSVPIQRIATALESLTVIALDTETTVTESILDKELKVISFSDLGGTVNCVIDVDFVHEDTLRGLMNAISRRLCIIHSVDFDFQMFKKYGVTLEKTWCTMLAEENLNNGYSKASGSLGLVSVLQERVGLDISKAEQLTFANRPYTDSQIAYAAMDTVKLGEVYTQQRQEMINLDRKINQRGNRGIIKANWWDNEFQKVASEMSMYGLNIDNEKWMAIDSSVRPIYERETVALNNLLVSEFREFLEETGAISNEDKFDGNIWTSAAKKLILLQNIFPEIFKTSKAELKKYLRDFDPDFPEELTKSLNGKKWDAHEYPITFTSDYAFIKLLVARTSKNAEEMDEILNNLAMSNWRDDMIEYGWLIPANTLQFNWASVQQRLALFQYINPDIPSTGKEVIEDYANSHPVFLHYLAWSDTEYQLKMFGKNFYENGSDIDGMFRTRFRLVLSTGRLGSVKPNLLNIPRKVVYRDAVIPHLGNVMIGADYDGEELIITATLAKELSWLEYLEKGYDIHSKNAELIFSKKWRDATEPGCQYYANDEEGNPKYHKCTCKGHMEMRDQSKAVSFGSIYGISKYKLAFNLKISEDEAAFILKRFFMIVPNVRKMMDRFSAYALANGHIIEPVFGRVRFFDKWKLAVPEEHGTISRAAFNTPIQSAGSAILKISGVLMRRYIKHNDLRNKIWLVLPYHDEWIVEALPEYEQVAKDMVEKYMKLASKLAKFDINAEAASGYSWATIH